MSNGSSIINFGDLSRPATILIERISDAIGGIYKPHQMKRIAKAEVETEKIKAYGNIEVSEIQERALLRFLNEETIKQINIEEITSKALPNINLNAQPENIENDWIANFFDKCRIISDTEMQTIWSKILSNEANTPGTYSKRTINLVGAMSKSDATLFTNLMKFNFQIGNATPLIFNESDKIYNDYGINFNELIHLQDLGLITFGNIAGYKRLKLPDEFTIPYFEKSLKFKFLEKGRDLDIGNVLLSKIGKELSTIVSAEPVKGFLEYVIDFYQKKKVEVVII